MDYWKFKKKKIDYKYQKTDNDRMKAPLLFS